MKEVQLIVYKASAGSGKTFTLTVEYIKRLVANPLSFKNILAVTFTNKACDEMKKRIIGQLYGIANSLPASDGYLKTICGDNYDTHDRDHISYIRKQCGKALSGILHDYSSFRIETIDSFFQTMAKGLARELNLSPNISVEIDDEAILDMAVDKMIEELTPQSPVFRWLADYVEEKISDNKSWNIANEIKSFGRNIFNERYMQTEEHLRKQLADAGHMNNLRNRLRLIEKEAEDELKAQGSKFMQLTEKAGLGADDFLYKDKGVWGYFKKLENGQCDDKLLNSRTKDAMIDCNKWASKKSANAAIIKAMAESTLMDLLDKAEKKRKDAQHTITSCKETMRHFNNLFLLDKINTEVRKINEEKNNFMLAETILLLHDMVNGNDTSFIYEKTGSVIQTIMVDEFQDTSVMQWSILKNIFAECLAGGNDCFIVGDVKQSIYRWRNGDWSILAGMKDKFHSIYPIRLEQLDTNYRSAQEIINFNNNIFSDIITLLAGNIGDNTRKDILKDIYADVKQKPGNKGKKGGYVRCTFIEPDRESTYDEKMLEELHACITGLLDKGVAQKDIAIFCRTNTEIAGICNYFNCHHPELTIVSDEAFRLDYSPVVRLIVSCLRYASDPDNILAGHECSYLYSNIVIGNDEETSLTYEMPAEIFDGIKKAKDLSPYECIETIYRTLHLNAAKGGDAYVFALLDEVTAFQDGNDYATIEEFLKQWDEKIHSDKIPAGNVDGIKILTIHKSKGLEFHTVILPYCTWKLEKRGGQLWCKADEAPFSEIDLVPVEYGRHLEHSAYASSYHKEQLQQWIDNINVLYVAFTRASENLIIFGQNEEPDDNKEKVMTVSSLLKKSLATAEGYAETTFEYGSIVPSIEKQEENNANIFLSKEQNIGTDMYSSMTELSFRQSNESASFITEEGETATNYLYIDAGKLYHRLFSTIETADDVENGIDDLIREGVIEYSEKEKIKEFVTRAINRPEVAEWFSGRYRLYNECNIIYSQHGKALTKRPDRVMTEADNAIIVDFKFGKENKRYSRQVKEYAALLKKMGYNNISGYLWYVYENKIEKVI